MSLLLVFGSCVQIMLNTDKEHVLSDHLLGKSCSIHYANMHMQFTAMMAVKMVIFR